MSLAFKAQWLYLSYFYLTGYMSELKASHASTTRGLFRVSSGGQAAESWALRWGKEGSWQRQICPLLTYILEVAVLRYRAGEVESRECL